MNFQSVLKYWDADDQASFDDALQTFLNEHQWGLPLDDFCNSGGCADDVEFEIVSSEETEDEIISEIKVYLTESISTSCPDINFPEKRAGTLTITIDKGTGEGRIEASPDEDYFSGENY